MKSMLALTALFSTALVPSAHAQQEYWALGRFGKIWQIEDYQGSSPVLTEFAHRPGFALGVAGTKVGIEVDPATGDLFVLYSNVSFADDPNSYILRFDRATGIPSMEFIIPEPFLVGLARRWDGKFYTIHNEDFEPHELWLLDAQTGTWTAQDLEQDVGGVIYQPLAIDANGNVLMDYPLNGLRTVDPIGGEVLAEKDPAEGILALYATDQDGTLYGADLAGRLHRFDAPTGTWIEYFDTSPQTNYLFDVAFRYGADGQGLASLCDGQPNSTGQVGTLELLGSAVAANNQLELNSRGLPANVLGYYLLSNRVHSLPVGQGVLCLGQPLFRFNTSVLVASAQGTVRFPVNLGQLANGSPALPGDTYHFQLWHRDTVGGVGTSNLSSAVSVTFE